MLVGLHGVAVKPDEPFLDGSWVGAYPGEARLLVEHIRTAVAIAANDEASILSLSGAATAEGIAWSEAETCIAVASHFGWWGTSVGARAFPEVHARDSLGNVAFSFALFFEQTGFWPQQVTAVGWQFKEERYYKHAAALGLQDFTYIGINDPPADLRPAAIAGEQRKLLDLQADPYLRSERYRQQRRGRNPHRTPLPSFSNSAMNAFIRFLYGDDLVEMPPSWK